MKLVVTILTVLASVTVTTAAPQDNGRDLAANFDKLCNDWADDGHNQTLCLEHGKKCREDKTQGPRNAPSFMTCIFDAMAEPDAVNRCKQDEFAKAIAKGWNCTAEYAKCHRAIGHRVGQTSIDKCAREAIKSQPESSGPN